MAKVKSNHDAPLPLPIVGTVLQPGKAVNVERWSVVCEHSTVRAWLAAGVIEVGSDQKPDPDPPKGRKAAKSAAPVLVSEESVE